MTDTPETFLALDVGARRIGVAVSNTQTRLPQPLQAINVDEQVFQQIKQLVAEQSATKVVVGLPRSLDGNETPQTLSVRTFTRKLRHNIDVPVYLIDEAVTSVQAESELKARGRPYDKGDIDNLAAVYILEDFLHAHQTIS